MVKKKIYQNTLDILLLIFPQAKIDSSRGHEHHIRCSNVTEEQYNNFLSYISNNHDGISEYGIIQDTKYSTSYQTFFLLHNNDIVPCVFSYRDLKQNKKDSITQKQLTPNKLNIVGKYTNLNDLVNKTEKALDVHNPKLSDHWETQSPDELKNLLKKMVNQIAYPENNISYNTREQEILNAHKSSIGKDFGEILASIDILKKHSNVTISIKESSSIFDIFYIDEFGVVNKFNTKSGDGSGQSFKGVISEVNSLDSTNFETNSKAHICIDMIKILCSEIDGRNKIFKVSEVARKLNLHNDICGVVLNEISIEFFKGEAISLDNYCSTDNFEDYKNKILGIFKKLNIKDIIGIPTGTKDEKPHLFYEKNKLGKENAILFLLATIISGFFDIKVITTIMQKLLKTKIFILHFTVDSKGVSFFTPTEINYKFHYWANFKSPTNNLLGFKTIYDKKI